MRRLMLVALAPVVACTALRAGDAPRGAPDAGACDASGTDGGCDPCGRACGAGERCVRGVCAPALAAPRPLAPLTLRTTRSRRPVLRWVLAGGDGARVELCRDRGMTEACVRFDAQGAEGAPPEELALTPGVWFWRLRARSGAVTSEAPSATWALRVGTVESALGSTLDLDGNGTPELAVGAPRVEGYAGRVYLYRGFGDPDPPPWMSRRGPNGGEFGNAVANAGDVNRDGYFDLAVGAPGAGRVYLYYGAPMGLLPEPERRSGPEDAQRYGEAVAGVGDLDGDGYDDVATSPRATDDARGRVDVYPGGPEGLAVEPSRTLAGERNARFGAWVWGAGDVNGDGFEDLAVGAPAQTGNSGAVYLFHGGPGGVPEAPSTTLTGVDLLGSFGVRFSRAGDVNADGYSDLAVAAPTAEGGRGRVYVYHGGPSGVGPRPATTLTGPAPGVGLGSGLADGADLDGDGYTDLVVGATGGERGIGDGAVFVYRGGPEGVAAGAWLRRLGPDGGDSGYGFTLAVADLNRDGRADLCVGAVGVFHNTGRVYVYLHGAEGIAEAPLPIIGPGGVQGVFGWSLAARPPRAGLRGAAL